MKFAEIIRNANLNQKNFERCADMEITLFDGKDRICLEKEVKYAEPLFIKNKGSFKNFQNFLKGLEDEKIISMNVKIDMNSVVLFYKTPRAIVFLRIPSMDPMDYME